MKPIVRIYTKNKEELNCFLKLFYNNQVDYNSDEGYWQKSFDNPIELSDISAAFIDNKFKYASCNMWICIDRGVFINITDDNCDSFIKYLFERFPY